MVLPDHGSNPQYTYKAMDIRMPEQIVDLSANINPIGPPTVLKEIWKDLIDEIVTYPDPHSVALRKSIARKEGLEPEAILIGNGGAELIHQIGRWLSRSNVMIIHPTFSEYEKACQINDCTIHHFILKENDWDLDLNRLKVTLPKMDAVFICNPTNPTGVLYSASKLEEIIMEANNEQCYVIVDEAFYDFPLEEITVTPLVKKYTNLIVLRSMTKMFSIPGIRLGFLMAGETVVRELENYQVHWSVNGIAQKVGEILLEEKDFIRQTQYMVKKEREKLFAFFDESQFRYSPSQTNFYLLRDPWLNDQTELFRFLLENGIVSRHTHNFKGLDGRWLRFAVKGELDHGKLMDALTEWKSRP
ncbi:MAG: threonine-phosphate decarboxylase CobD [Bacillota bacterium]|uniref:threonine-phosphate decarboxylase CobD n=1 Tax=Rossellomorea sp. FM04394 TaxID=3243076 RepID=UPI0035A61656